MTAAMRKPGHHNPGPILIMEDLPLVSSPMIAFQEHAQVQLLHIVHHVIGTVHLAQELRDHQELRGLRSKSTKETSTFLD